MIFPQFKKLQKISVNSKALIIPNEWLSLRKIKADDELKIDVDDNYDLIITPSGKKGEEIVKSFI